MPASMQQIIDSRNVSKGTLRLLQLPTVEALMHMCYDGEPAVGAIMPAAIVVHESGGVSLEPEPASEPLSEEQIVQQWAQVMRQAIEVSGRTSKSLSAIVDQCLTGDIQELGALYLALERRRSAAIYWPLIVFIVAALLALLAMQHYFVG